MQFRHIEHTFDTNLLDIIFDNCLHKNGFNFDGPDNIVITQIHSALNYTKATYFKT